MPLPLTFRNLARNISLALPNPTISETLGGLDDQRVSHDVLDFFEVASVKLECEDKTNSLTAFDHRLQVMHGKKLYPIPGRALGVLRWRGDAFR